MAVVAVQVRVRAVEASGAEPGQGIETIEEMLALVASGRGCCLVPAEGRDYYRRPDIRFLPIIDAPPCIWGLVWQTAAENERIRTFVRISAAAAG